MRHDLWRPGWHWADVVLVLALLSLMWLVFKGRYLPPDTRQSRPPCELEHSGQPCGCEPDHGPCTTPCSGCCDGGCKPAPPPPTSAR